MLHNTASLSSHYFVWSVNSTTCQQYSVQCAEAVQKNVAGGTMCHIKYATNHEAPTLLPLNTQNVPYKSPGTVHHFEFSTMVNEQLSIVESLTRVGQLCLKSVHV